LGTSHEGFLGVDGFESGLFSDSFMLCQFDNRATVLAAGRGSLTFGRDPGQRVGFTTRAGLESAYISLYQDADVAIAPNTSNPTIISHKIVAKAYSRNRLPLIRLESFDFASRPGVAFGMR
jgi:hypothetical protein